MSTKNAVNEPEASEAAQGMGLSVIDRKDTEVALPALPTVTDFEVAETVGKDGAPFDLNLNTNTGLMSLTVNQDAIVHQMCFGVLKIKDGPRKGEVITEEMVDGEIERMKGLLEKDDLFADGVADEYRDAKIFAAKINTPFNDFKVEKKTPINRLGSVIQGVPAAALGEFVQLRQDVLDRLKNHKIETEKREREATAADNLLREKTADEIPRIAYLVLDCRDKSAEEVKVVSAELLATKFTPHTDQADRYNEARSQAMQALAAMYDDKVLAESAAALKAKQDAEKAAAEQAELEELRAGKAEQEMKDNISQNMSSANIHLANCVGATPKEISKAIESAANIGVCMLDAYGDHFDRDALDIVTRKMQELLKDAKQKEADAAAAKKAEAGRLTKEAAEKKEREDREKAEVAAALEKANQELLLEAGFTFDGKAYTKGGFLIRADIAKCSPGSDIGAFIINTDKKIADNEAAAEKAEEARIKKEKAAAEKAAAEKEAARKSYALKVEEMTAEVKKCKGPDEMVAALLEDRIPHVRFSAEY
jgi:hypothetical protein